MKYFISTFFLLVNIFHSDAQVAINTDNTAPDASAMIDIKSDSKGMLIPRMTATQRQNINDPATGLVLYDNDENSFWYFDGIVWKEILSDKTAIISDLDNDTKIQVEESSDEDFIRLDIAGDEVVTFTKNGNGDMIMEPSASTANLFIGRDAGTITTGTANVFVGDLVGESNTSGERNTIIGAQAGRFLANGNSNIFLGTIAGVNIESGNSNVLIGDSAGAGRDTASQNTFVGFAAGLKTTPGLDTTNFNTYIGSLAGLNASGTGNVFVGYLTGGDASSLGDNNTIIGPGAGQLAEGDGHVFIGLQAGSLQTGNNKLHIHNSSTLDPLIYGEFDNEILKINGSLTSTDTLFAENGIRLPFSVVVDDTYVGSEGNYISFGHEGVSTDFLGYTDNTFYFRNSPNTSDTDQPMVYASAFNTYSSRRWKNSIVTIDNAIEIIKKLRGVSYVWNEDHGGKNDFGFIAEEINKVLPHLAPKNKDGQVDGLDYAKLTPFLVEALKEQQAQIEQQQKLIDLLIEFKVEVERKLEVK